MNESNVQSVKLKRENKIKTLKVTLPSSTIPEVNRCVLADRRFPEPLLARCQTQLL